MKVRDILARKGHEVMTTSPQTTLREAARLLKTHRIGALVVVENDAPVGIISERDIVNAVADAGAEAIDAPVATFMSRDMITCGLDDTTDHLMEVMTEKRVRHLPVLEDGKLAGLVSIGDVVKQRIEEISFEAEQMKMFIAS